MLAAAEYECWNRERIADGWALANERNAERKETPYLLPWKQLKKRYPDIAELDAVGCPCHAERGAALGTGGILSHRPIRSGCRSRKGHRALRTSGARRR
jgi:hypothetical protein